MTDVRLVDADCLDAESGMPTLPSESVDVAITDPPYEGEAHSKGRRLKAAGWRQHAYDDRAVVESVIPFDPMTADLRLAASRELGRLTRRWVLVFCQVEGAPLWRADLEAAGLRYIRTMVWVKPDGQPQLSGDRPGMGYESIVVAHRPGRTRWNGRGRTGVFSYSKASAKPHGEKAPHPTTKPLHLMDDLVALFSDPGELVLDPFAGSGTTGVACRRLGRRFIGFEKNPDWAAIAQRRLDGERAKPTEHQPDLFGAAR